MRKRIRLITVSSLVLAALVAAVSLVGCNRGGEGGHSAVALNAPEQTVTGKVVDTELTACGVIEGKRGTCEGNLVMEVPGEAGTNRITLQVTRDVVLTKAGKTVFLPQLQGSTVTATYRSTPDGKNLASAVSGT